MPIDDTSRKFVPRLKKLDYDVTYREYAVATAPLQRSFTKRSRGCKARAGGWGLGAGGWGLGAGGWGLGN